MNRYPIVLILIAIAFIGCKKDNATSPDAASNLKVGSQWVYKYTQFNQSGAVVNTVNLTMSITAEQTIAGEKWWVLNITGSTSPSFLRKATNGYVTFKNGLAQLQFKIPAALNDTWRVTFSNSAGDYSDYTVKGVNQPVTVPAGTFSTYFIEGYDSNSLEDKVWYNEAQIMVKQQEYDQATNGSMYMDNQLELVSYSP